MKNEKKAMIFAHIMCDIAAVLLLFSMYLLYRNYLAEDMIKELNRDLERLMKENRGGGGNTEHEFIENT